MSQLQTFLRACPTSWREDSWHRYGMKKLYRCHRMYTYSSVRLSVCLLQAGDLSKQITTGGRTDGRKDTGQ